MAKYSDADIARLAGQDYKSLTGYEQRLVRGHNRGLSRSESRGHARVEKGEKPVSQRRETPKLQKGTGKVTPGAQKQKPAPKPAPKPPIAKRNLGQYVRHKRNEKGEIIRTRVNARGEESLGKQIDRVSDSRRVIFHLINTKTGEEIRAIPNKGVTAADLKEAIADGITQGKSQKEATRDALSDLFRFYAVDIATGVRTSDELDGIPDDVTNFVMYAE